MKNLKIQLTDTSKKIKICCSTNPNIPLPQITNPSDNMVGKEIEVEIIHNWLELDDKEPSDFAIIKPISKETSTNETLEEVAEQSYSKQCNPDTSEYECFFHYTEDLLYKAGFEQGYKHAEKQLYSEDEVIALLKLMVFKNELPLMPN